MGDGGGPGCSVLMPSSAVVFIEAICIPMCSWRSYSIQTAESNGIVSSSDHTKGRADRRQNSRDDWRASTVPTFYSVLLLVMIKHYMIRFRYDHLNLTENKTSEGRSCYNH